MILYTAGYEGLTLADFIRLLKTHDINQLADIRDAPISRKPGFSKTELSHAVAGAGIRYLHVRALGCPKPIRARYKATRDWTRYTRDFTLYLAAQAAAVASLRETAAAAATCLMCYEADFNRCHRLFVAEAVIRQGDEIRHLPLAPRSPAVPLP